MKGMEEEKVLGTGLEGAEDMELHPKKQPVDTKPQKYCNEMDVEFLIKGGSKEELDEFKIWLFKENIRILAEKNELEKQREKWKKEKDAFIHEMHSMGRAMENDRKRLVQENRFFDQKMQILQSGFAQLDADRRRFQKEKDRFEAKREVYDDSQTYFARTEMAEMLFKGVNSFLALKKRYKDLIKMFHPDNVAGDHEMVQIINRVYDELKKAYEMGMQA